MTGSKMFGMNSIRRTVGAKTELPEGKAALRDTGRNSPVSASCGAEKQKKPLKLKIATACTYSLPGDVVGNLKKIGKMAAAAAEGGCRYILTPELSACGYGNYGEVLRSAECAGDGVIYAGLCTIAARYGIAVSAGFAEKEGDKTYISHYTVFPDGSFRVSRKHRVTPNESSFSPSVPLRYDGTEPIGQVPEGKEKFTLIDLFGVPAVIVICADWGIKNLMRKLYRLGAKLVLLPTGAGGKLEERYTLADLKNKNNAALRERYLADLRKVAPDRIVLDCIDYGMAFACCNLTGFDGRKHYHCGSSKIIGADGQLLSCQPESLFVGKERETLGMAELEFEC